MMHARLPRRLCPILLTLLLPALSACGGDAASTPAPAPVPVPPAPAPVVLASYDVRAAVLQLYGQPHSWELKGQTCCVNTAIYATLSYTPRPPNGGTFNIGGDDVSGVDIVLTQRVAGVADAKTAGLIWYNKNGQALMFTGEAEDRMEVTQTRGQLPSSAKVGDSGSNGDSTTLYQYPLNAKTLRTTAYRWELKTDAAARVLLCLNYVETPDPAYAGSNPALAAKTTGGACYGLKADSTLSGYVSVSRHGFTNLGYDLSTE